MNQVQPRSIPQLLFRPLQIGKIEVKNRIIMPAMGTNFEPVTGPLSPVTYDYFLARARGGVGLILMSAVGWARMEMEPPPGQDSGHQKLVELLHRQGVKVGTQLSHRGPHSHSGSVAYQPMGPSSREKAGSHPVRGLSLGEVQEIVARFVRGAIRAREAGFDLVEVHAGHGYLLSSFLSPFANRRSDEYGGTLEGRARFLVQVVQAIKEAVGDFTVSVRLNGSDFMAGGVEVEEAKAVAAMLERAGADLLDVSGGVYGSYHLTIPPCYAPRGCFVPLAAEVKKVVSKPVAVAGRINDPRLAEQVLSSGAADLIAMGRALVADPELPRKALEGKDAEIRKCIACNKCIDIFWGGGFACTVNPEVGREREMELSPAAQPKKVVVIGGGLAGLEAARVCALRGHRVTLCEREPELGGQWLLAATPPGKKELRELLPYYRAQLKALGVEVKLGQPATAEAVAAMAADAVVMATGAQPLTPPVLGAERAVSAWDVLKGRVAVGDRVLVIGGGSTGLETALFLAVQGKRVTVVEMLKRYGADLGGTLLFYLRHELQEHRVQVLTSIRVIEIGEKKVRVDREGVEETWEGLDSVVLAAGARPDRDLEAPLRERVKELHVIGDAAKPGNGLEAIRAGAEVGRRI